MRRVSSRRARFRGTRNSRLVPVRQPAASPERLDPEPPLLHRHVLFSARRVLENHPLQAGGQQPERMIDPCCPVVVVGCNLRLFSSVKRLESERLWFVFPSDAAGH